MVRGPGAFLDTEHITSLLGLVDGMHVADFGCGSGYFTVALAHTVGKNGVVTAIDVQEEPLDAVRTKAESLGLGNIRAIRANLEVAGGTSLGDNTQDLVLLANVLFQSQKKEDIVKESVRVLKSGGRLVVIDWKKEHGPGEGGLGPPDDLRTREDDMKRIVESQGVRFQKPLDAGTFYYGLLFVKE